MKVLIASSECAPFATTGDLGEAVYSHAIALSKLGHEVSVAIPMYKNIKDSVKTTFIGNSNVYIGENEKYVGVCKKVYENLTFYFIDNEEYFNHYTYYAHANDGERFTFFDDAILESLNIIKYYPDIIHLHDWPTGLIPYLLKSKYKYIPEYRNIKTVYTISNLNFQGIFPIEMETIIDAQNTPILYDNNKINFMKAGIVEADLVTTVSLGYKKDTYNTNLGIYLKDRKDEYIEELEAEIEEYRTIGTVEECREAVVKMKR